MINYDKLYKMGITFLICGSIMAFAGLLKFSSTPEPVTEMLWFFGVSAVTFLLIGFITAIIGALKS